MEAYQASSRDRISAVGVTQLYKSISTSAPVSSCILFSEFVYRQTSAIRNSEKFTVPVVQDLECEFIAINSFENENLILVFSEALIATMTVGALGFEANLPQLGIREFGDTKADCVTNLYDAISFRWREYAQEKDELLDAEAQKIANYLRNAIVK